MYIERASRTQGHGEERTDILTKVLSLSLMQPALWPFLFPHNTSRKELESHQMGANMLT